MCVCVCVSARARICVRIPAFVSVLVEGILRAYCREVGLEYCDSMINWEPLSEDDFQRIFFNGFESEWHTNMKTSAHLSRRPKESEEHGGDVVMGDQGTRDAIEEAVTSNMARYEHMYEQRLVA